MLYNVLVGFVFAQLHYITKKAASFLFLDVAFSFTAPFKFIQEFANSSDVNSECAAERFKSALIAGSDSVELPLAAVAVQLADDQRGFD